MLTHSLNQSPKHITNKSGNLFCDDHTDCVVPENFGILSGASDTATANDGERDHLVMPPITFCHVNTCVSYNQTNV